ncbi:MAG: carboxypeptidase-like regulatory domain-containing protein, partial [Ignavibacteria bacterium]|nr:carboxypeptidase-like regulatory domain-containing protein [Ignavibacteria bacterium]
MSKPAILILLLLLLSLAESCSETDNPANNVNPDKGFLGGHFHPRTEYTDMNSTDTVDYYGCSVILDGTNFTAVTDSAGRWLIGNITPGLYTISYSKDGYSYFKNTGAEVTHSDTAILPQYLYKHTTARVNNLNVNFSGAQMKITCDISNSLRRDYLVRYFFSLDSNILNSPVNYMYTEYEQKFNVMPPGEYSEYYAELIDLYSHGMPSGSRVYIIA